MNGSNTILCRKYITLPIGNKEILPLWRAVLSTKSCFCFCQKCSHQIARSVAKYLIKIIIYIKYLKMIFYFPAVAIPVLNCRCRVGVCRCAAAFFCKKSSLFRFHFSTRSVIIKYYVNRSACIFHKHDTVPQIPFLRASQKYIRHCENDFAAAVLHGAFAGRPALLHTAKP